MTAALAIALCIIGALASALLGLILWVLTGIRDDGRETRKEIGALVKRVGEHDSFISAFKMQYAMGGSK